MSQNQRYFDILHGCHGNHIDRILSGLFELDKELVQSHFDMLHAWFDLILFKLQVGKLKKVTFLLITWSPWQPHCPNSQKTYVI